jgi:hypothetical protein
LDWLAPVLVLLAAVLTQIVSVWRDRRSRAGQIQDERLRAYSDLVTELRMVPMTFVKGYRHGTGVDLTEALTAFHLARTRVELLASPQVREALDGVGTGFNEYQKVMINRVNDMVVEGKPPDELFLVDQWDVIMLARVNHLRDVMRRDLGLA